MHYVVEILPYEEEQHADYSRRVFRFPIDGGKEFDYRMRVSANAFFYGTKGGSHRKMEPGMKNRARYTMYDHYRTTEWTFQSEKMSHKIIDVANIWEFYKAIGYNYKTKKWSDQA